MQPISGWSAIVCSTEVRKSRLSYVSFSLRPALQNYACGSAVSSAGADSSCNTTGRKRHPPFCQRIPIAAPHLTPERNPHPLQLNAQMPLTLHARRLPKFFHRGRSLLRGSKPIEQPRQKDPRTLALLLALSIRILR